MMRHLRGMQDIPAATESAGQAAAAVDGVFHVLAVGEEAEQEVQEQPHGEDLHLHAQLSGRTQLNMHHRRLNDVLSR